MPRRGSHRTPRSLIELLAGYGLLMVLAQLRFLPTYASLPFMPSTWAFAFSWAAVATTGLHWINAGDATGQRIYGWLVLAAITLFVGGIGLRTAVAIARGQLLPPAAPVPDR